MANYSLPTADFITSTLNGAITSSGTTATIGSGLTIPATNGILQIDYNSTFAVGVSSGPETVSYASYNSATGALTGLTRGVANTIGVSHANGAVVQCGDSTAYFGQMYPLGIGAWSAWTPTYSAGGSMTYTSVTTNIANYMQIGKIVFFRISANGTTGGSGAANINFTLPVTAKDTSHGGWGAYLHDNGADCAGAATMFSTTGVSVIRYDDADWHIGGSETLEVVGTYEAA